MRFSPLFRRLLAAGLAVLWLSGTTWWILDRWFPTMGEFGPEPHPALPKLLALHGFVAYFALVLFGSLSHHITSGWKANRFRLSGGLLVALAAVLAISGLGLYYLGDEAWRAVSHRIHLVVGLAAPLGWLAHRFKR